MKKLLALSLLFAFPAIAAEPVTSSVGIVADSLEYVDGQKQYIARGNAEVEQKGVKILADLLIANYVEGPDGKNVFTTVTAEGNVRIQSGKGEVTGERGVYDVAREVAVLKGNNLQLKMDADTVTAKDVLEYWQKDQVAVARGEAVAIRGDNRLTADVLTAKLAENKQGQLEVKQVGAEGSVVITTPQETARGAKGVYDVARQVAQLEGGVKITRGENQLNGSRAEVNMATGVSRLMSGPGQRVRGLIVPKDAPEVK